MTPHYRLPNGAVPVLVSSDVPELLRREAAALLDWAVDHPDVTPAAIAATVFRTRSARRNRALVMATGRDELLAGLRAVVAGTDHPAVIRAPASARRIAHVFPGQGGQRAGMGRPFYDASPAYRAEANRCAEAFAACGAAPLDYLLDERYAAADAAATVQPALFTQLAGLSALWRDFGVVPDVTVGHSQGEIAAAYVSGLITLHDAVRLVGIRTRAVAHLDSGAESATGAYAMAMLAVDRESCEALLARHSGWAEVSVVNAPQLTGISGDRATVQHLVDALAERGTFARVIGVRYPAHTSAINGLAGELHAAVARELQNPTFADADTACLGATLGGPLGPDLPVEEYWFWNLRNTVRFDKAVAAAVALGVDTFVELSAHPTLHLALRQNLVDQTHLVAGTASRTADPLDEFTRNLARVAVADLDYPWDRLRSESDAGTTPLPLPGFPNTVMNDVTLWLPYEEELPRRAHRTPAAAAPPVAETAPARLLTEEWVRLAHRALRPPRAIGIVDHTGAGAALAAALCAAAADMGATARLVGTAEPGLDTLVILLPQPTGRDVPDAVAEVAEFFGRRSWWPGVGRGVTDCWLVTVGAEAVVAEDTAPDLVHAALSAGFRSVGAEYRDVRFRQLDLPPGAAPDRTAPTLLAALHTAQEADLALRHGALYAKRIIAASPATPADTAAEPPPGHVLIIGGTGTLGLEFCAHFAHRGTPLITLVCRSELTDRVDERLRQLRSATPAQIRITRCDVTDPAALARLAGPPADLIIHAAVHYAGAEFDDLTPAGLDAELQPKVVGVAHVLETVPRSAACRVLLCSSVSATVGGRGLIGYAAANRMLDALAHRLRAAGIDAGSVQWGQWPAPDLNPADWARLHATGLLQMEPADAITLGLSGLRRNTVVAAVDLPRARAVLQTCGRAALLSGLPDEGPEAGPAEPAADLRQRLIGVLAGTIGADAVHALDERVPMVAIGLDSLQALEFHRRVKTEFDHELDMAELLGGASVADVLAKLGG